MDVGFCEEVHEKWRVQSAQFPSKVGGKPAWLSYENIPGYEDLKCPKCENQMCFLCQVYAPLEDDPANFHRTIFIFLCRSATCCQRNRSDTVRVFRNQLSWKNPFYSHEPPPEEEPVHFDAARFSKLCELCGCFAEKTCSKCKKAWYCSREHQIIHWKDHHKDACGNPSKPSKLSSILFTEYEIVIESEEYKKSVVNEEDQLQLYNRLVSEGRTGTLPESEEAELENHATCEKDKVFANFRKRVDCNPEQILRYERGGEPLWIASEPKPEAVPDCEQCGGPRQFEFQVMPQLLTVLKENELDFGVLLVYTCKRSCSSQKTYSNEFVFKQDVCETDTV